MITENLSTLKIHKLTQAQYDRELAAGNIDASALYLTPDNTEETKIVTGSYVGTGTYGSSNPCCLTFDFKPKLLAFYNTSGSWSIANSESTLVFLFTDTSTEANTIFSTFYGDDYNGYGNHKLYLTWGNNFVEYYATGQHSTDSGMTATSSAPAGQFNASGETYNYVAIG